MAADLQTRPSLLLRLRDAEDEAAWSQFVAEEGATFIEGFAHG